MRYILGVFLFMTSCYVSAMCYSGAYSIFNQSKNNLSATGPVILVDLNNIVVNTYYSTEQVKVNFESANGFHCQFSKSGLQVKPVENNNAAYFKVLSGETNDYIFVEVMIGNNISGVFNKAEKDGVGVKYFNFTASEINETLKYGVQYKVVISPSNYTSVRLNQELVLASPLRFTEANGTDVGTYNLAQNVKVKFIYTPTTCYFPESSVKVKDIAFHNVLNGAAESADNSITIKCDNALAYSSREIYYRFESQNHIGDVLRNEYAGDDSAGDIGFKMELKGETVNLDNNRYILVGWGEKIPDSHDIPLTFKYFPYGKYHSGHVLSRVKVVIGYD